MNVFSTVRGGEIFFGYLLRKDVRQCQGGVDSPNVTCWGMVTEERVRQEREE